MSEELVKQISTAGEIANGGPLSAPPRAWLSSLFSKERKSARAPEGTRIYAVGDIHGCNDQLEKLLQVIEGDARGFKAGPKNEEGLKFHLVFLGDYVDRGPDSKGVIQALLNPPKGFEVSHLLGNHDQTLLDFLDDPSVFRVWRDFGARETLASYGVMPPKFDVDEDFAKARDELRGAMPAAHVEFLQRLELTVCLGGYCFVHAGLRPGLALEKQSREDLLWIRDEFLMSSADFGMVVVHGHTPTEQPVRRKNRIGVDTGAYATNRLTAAVLEGASVRFLSVG